MEVPFNIRKLKNTMNSSLLSVFTHKSIFLASLGASLLELIIVPEPSLIVLLLGAMMVDFITGIIKSWNQGQATTSAGFRKTVTKAGAYIGVILGMWLLASLFSSSYKQDVIKYSKLVDLTITFLTMIEIYSILENSSELLPKNSLAAKGIRKILKLLKGKIDNSNPLKDIDNEK